MDTSSSRAIVAHRIGSTLVLGVLAACGGGGSGGSAPKATVGFASSTASLTEDAASLSISVVLDTSLAALTKPLTVVVSDLGTGTASSGADYTAFAPTTVTFPIGSVDGDVQTVTLDPLADLLVEGADETVKLGLSQAAGGALGSKKKLTATLTDVDEATLTFAAASSATPDESSAGRTVTIELSLSGGATLGVDVTAKVDDTSGGSATSGSDYSAFAQHTVTFGSGSADGATQTVTVNVLDDATIEVDETVPFVLSAPSAGAVLGATTLHELTITDDDASGPSAFVATEGANGDENTLAYDELVDLGTQTVAAGPNAGTRVRVTNAGGAAMDLSAPSLSGSHPNDFTIEVELAPLSASPGSPEFSLAPDAPAPLQSLAPDAGPGRPLALDAPALAALAKQPRATLHGFPLPDGTAVTLDVRKLALPIADDAVLMVDGQVIPGGPRAALGDLTLWTGSALEAPGSRVFLALSSSGSQGFLQFADEAGSGAPGRTVHLFSDTASKVRVASAMELPASLGDRPADFCAQRLAPGKSSLVYDSSEVPDSAALVASDCKLAIETDYQLYQKFGSTNGVTNYVTSLIAAVSDQYFIDVQTTLSIVYLGVHSSSNDGWSSQDSGGNSGDLLDEFVAAWAPNNWPVAADLAHFISGASLGGGVAYLDVLCNDWWGFGVSGNIAGTINWGSWTGQAGSFTWDFVVVAHEIGHNFGSIHTHEFCPQLDRCYSNCSGTTSCTQGTIMSYCHTCGGMDNIDLYFHPVCANVMRASVNSSCLGLSALAAGDWVQYLVRFSPLTATGTRSANLEFDHDAPNETQPFKVRLTGTAQ